MVAAEVIPDNDVGVLHAAVCLGPFGQAVAAGMLVRIRPGGRHLVRVIRRHPQVLPEETGPLRHAGLRVGEGQKSVAGNQLVAHWLADIVAGRGIGNQPVPAGERVNGALRLRLGCQQRLLRVKGTGLRVVGTQGLGHRVDLVHRVVRAVDGHVQPHAEEVLVDVPAQLWGNHGAVLRLFSWLQGHVVDDAGQLHLELNVAVLVEVPKEAILVVADCRDEGDHQASGAAHLGLASAPVGVLPEDAEVLLVQADGVGNLDGFTTAVVQHSVEVVDLAQAVTAQRERVGQRPDACLADVEGVLAVVFLLGVSVRHHQLGQRGSVDDGTFPSLVLVTDAVEHETLTAGVAHPEAPFLPGNQIPVDVEARSFGLHHVQRLKVGAELLHELLGVVSVVGRQGDHAVVLNPQHLHRIQVNDCYDPLDGACVAVVIGAGLEPASGKGEPDTLFLGNAVIASRPGVHHHQAGVVDPPLAQGCLELGRGLDGVLAVEELVHHQARLDARNVDP